ncbi:HAD-like protein [Glonium stellatum]|uniref:HAD-like protein n=1 Tax=Glonium stellatum TaxID=574774 RepID=A0A8E2JLN8_9PEZI|nr:HAD-like protein [Glonium stellatum]
MAITLQALKAKRWFGFDLDDTLHNFRSASTTASLAVFSDIHEKHSIPVAIIASAYSAILKEKTRNAFTDNRTSTEYRKERFAALLEVYSLPSSDAYLDELAALYKTALAAALTLKPGALELFRQLKALGKQIIIITEGPKDAQKWTVEQLGLAPYVDVLVTSNEVGLAKDAGLFGEALQRCGIKSEEMVYVGDRLEKDVVPAKAVGVLAVLFDEQDKHRDRRVREGDREEVLRVKLLSDIGVWAARF